MPKALDRFLVPPPKNLDYNLDYLQRHVYQYYKNGLSIVPLEGAKPAVNLEEYVKRKPTQEEIMEWWGVNVNGSDIHEIYGKTENKLGVGIVCGSALAVLDFSDLELFKQFFLALADHTTVDREGMVYMSYHFMGKAWVMRDAGVKVLLRIKGNKDLNGFSRVPTSTLGGVSILSEGSVVVAPPSAVSEKSEADWRTDITNPIAEITSSEFAMLTKIIEKISKGEPLNDDDFSITGSLFSELGFSNETNKEAVKKEPEAPPKKEQPKKERGQNSLMDFLDETN